MTLHNVAFLVVLVLALAFFTRNVTRLIAMLQLGKPDLRTNNIAARLLHVAVVALGQSKLLREPVAGIMHFLIFWGFVVLLSAVLESIIEGLISGFSFAFLGPIYGPLVFLMDLFGLLVAASVVFALFRRYVLRPKRLADVDKHGRLDATYILLMILIVVLSMLGQTGARIALGEGHANEFRFASNFIANWFAGADPSLTGTWFYLLWWIHIIVVFVFLNYLPYSKHLHVLTSIPNVFLTKLEPRGALSTLNLADETATKFGASDVEDFTWKQLLDGYTCTECGRCTNACPANITGKPLDPRKIIVDLRHRLEEKAPFELAGIKPESIQPTQEDAKHPLHKQLVDDYISEEELWACTTCMACMQECPVQIEHIDAIVDMRRYLVLNESRFPHELQVTFQNLERNFSPWAFSHAGRADWAEGMNIPLMTEKPNAEILFWVGCAGSYDSRYKKVTQAFARLMQIAKIDFAILGTEEKCNGDPARRAGNEYLAQTLISENIATMNRYNVKKIVTTCPHCFNTMKNEYPQSGGTYEVVHHTAFIQELIEIGRIKIKNEARARITFHDSCYLGRYNEMYDEPRATLSAIPGTELVEMKRSRDRGFCCGAGGARMFMEETVGKRVNLERTEEALSLHPNTIGTACPFCMTMLTDGVKDKQAEESVQVKDIAELVLEAIT